MIADAPVTRWYLELLLLVALQRLVELRVADRHRRRLLARGGIEVGAAHYPWMVALHVSFLLACGVEVALFNRPFLPWLGVPMLGLVVLAAALRFWAIRSLGERWTTRVIVLPGEQRIQRGPYRFMRHPNYVAVVIEMAALPLVHAAWLTAVLWSVLNGLLLRHRVRVETTALRAASTFSPEPAPSRTRA